LNKAKNFTGTLSDKQMLYLIMKTKSLYYDIFFNSVVRFDKNKNIYVNFSDPQIIFLKQGLASANIPKYKKYENKQKFQLLINEANQKNIIIFNPKSSVYHKLNCKNGKKSLKKEFLLFEELPKHAKPCKYCFSENKYIHKSHSLKYQKQNYIKNLEFVKSYGFLQMFTEFGIGIYKPSSKCDRKMCKALLNEINSAQKNIDMAIYDISIESEIFNALKNAKKRGVNIRVITDSSFKKNNEYAYNLLSSISSSISDDSINQKNSSRLMHNKFLIFDNKKVWTGSTNLTTTGLSGFNSNVSFLLNSKDAAEIYEKEFENFLNKKFHSSKSKIIKNPISLNGINYEIYFSPKDLIINQQIISYVKSAKNYIYIPIFIITHKELATELVNAKKRGVDIKIIIDATSSRNKYSEHTFLRENNISVKTENFAGKMHIKAIIIDDKIVFAGSMNYTKSGNIYNDENVLKIENPQIAKDMKQNFMYIWNKIPDKYLKTDPAAESLESIGSCFDGIDNDYDGKIDFEDSSCRFR
jgi:phosphatidylserine/phosphatidylglycerophosphate/cardiolipin synthase-like enzyme